MHKMSFIIDAIIITILWFDLDFVVLENFSGQVFDTIKLKYFESCLLSESGISGLEKVAPPFELDFCSSSN